MTHTPSENDLLFGQVMDLVIFKRTGSQVELINMQWYVQQKRLALQCIKFVLELMCLKKPFWFDHHPQKPKCPERYSSLVDWFNWNVVSTECLEDLKTVTPFTERIDGDSLPKNKGETHYPNCQTKGRSKAAYRWKRGNPNCHNGSTNKRTWAFHSSNDWLWELRLISTKWKHQTRPVYCL